jgi:hypothetical protein
MSKPEGIYLSSDYRLTNSATGEFVKDSAVKYLSVHYPGDTKAMLGFTGIAELDDGTPVGLWLRETLRGGNEPFDESMAHLKQRLIRDFAKYRQHLIVTVIVMGGDGKRGHGGFTNQKASGYISRDFNYRMQEFSGPGGFASGFPAAQAKADGMFDVVEEQLKVRPRHVRDHMNLLAAVNRRVAEADQRRAVATGVEGAVGTVSPYCQVAFMPAKENDYKPESRIYTKPGEDHSAPFVLPLLAYGIDTMVLTEGGVGNIDPEKGKRAVERRP